MTKLRCKNCNYSFESDVLQKVCPYCGEKKVDNEPSAQELIRKVK